MPPLAKRTDDGYTLGVRVSTLAAVLRKQSGCFFYESCSGASEAAAADSGSNADGGTIAVNFAIWRRASSSRAARCDGAEAAISAGTPDHAASSF